MNEETKAALIDLGVRLNGQHGIGPTGKQWNAHRPKRLPMAKSLCLRSLGVRETDYNFEAWNELLKLAGLRYPPHLLARARAKQRHNDPDFTGEDVEFVYGRAQDSVLHVRPFVEREIWWSRGRRWVTVEIALVISGERLGPVAEFSNA